MLNRLTRSIGLDVGPRVGLSPYSYQRRRQWQKLQDRETEKAFETQGTCGNKQKESMTLMARGKHTRSHSSGLGKYMVGFFPPCPPTSARILFCSDDSTILGGGRNQASLGLPSKKAGFLRLGLCELLSRARFKIFVSSFGATVCVFVDVWHRSFSSRKRRGGA